MVSEGSPSGQVIASSVSQPLGSQPFVVTWEKLPADYGLPDNPVENVQQPILAAALTDALGEAGFIQPEMLIASCFQFWLDSNGQPKKRRENPRLVICAACRSRTGRRSPSQLHPDARR